MGQTPCPGIAKETQKLVYPTFVFTMIPALRAIDKKCSGTKAGSRPKERQAARPVISAEKKRNLLQ
jgi:hypothetical protein